MPHTHFSTSPPIRTGSLIRHQSDRDSTHFSFALEHETAARFFFMGRTARHLIDLVAGESGILLPIDAPSVHVSPLPTRSGAGQFLVSCQWPAESELAL